MYITRFAPSPTGHLTLGNVRTCYFNWLAARASGGKFILRVDDTDLVRSKPEYTDSLLETMKWLGLDYDEIIYQSNRFETYRAFASELVKSGFAEVKDGGTVLKLNRDNPPYPRDFPTSWHDEIAGDVKITDDDYLNMDGMGLIKADGSPAYNFCSIVDDFVTGVNYIIRGVDHITNTSKQVVLWKLCFPSKKEMPKFCHIGLIGLDGKKLSKREGAASVLYYREKGYEPESLLNFVARLGWGPTVDDKTTALLPRERMLELFLNGGKMKSNMAFMDMKKLDSFDRKYKGRIENEQRKTDPDFRAFREKRIAGPIEL